MKFLLALIGVACAILITTSCTVNKGNFQLVNGSKEPIKRASVTVCGQMIELENIQPAESKSGSYEVRSDSHYDVRIEFQSGKQLSKKVGYVTNGLDFQHTLVVTDIDIKIVSNF